MNAEKDYTRRGWWGTLAVIVALLGVSFIPPQQVGGIALRRANILSDLTTFDDVRPAAEEPVLEEIEIAEVDFEEIARLVADTVDTETVTTFEWDLSAEKHAEEIEQAKREGDEILFVGMDSYLPKGRRISTDTTRRHTGAWAVPIEDFDTTGHSPMQAFYKKLANPRRSVRIAVLGDSFIEGDILTADLREQLQLRYGGEGCGFAPMASPLTGFRRTVKTQSRGWSSYNLMQRRTTPAALADAYSVSGWVCQPTDGATTRWEGSLDRKQLDSCTTARILFLSRGDSRVSVTVNDTERRTFEVAAAPELRQIVVHAPIRSLTFGVEAGADSLIGYGAIFERELGVVVDNYSIRSNNGQALFHTSPALNAQMDQLVGHYDLVILQYGLNIMQTGVHSYPRYREQIEQLITYVRQCFPEAAVLVLSVSDRSVRSERGYEPMDSAPSMVETQRAAARNTGAAFWSVYDAMQSLGGMAQFVANGWAGKDYTHINFGGGRRVAYALFDALDDGTRIENYRRLKSSKNLTDLIDPALQRRVDSLLRLRTAPRPLNAPRLR